MRRSALLGLGAGALMTFAAGAALALPIAPGVAADAPVQRVIYGDGCGPYAFRTRRGFCRPIRRGYGPRPYWGPPRYYGAHPFYGRPPHWRHPRYW